MNREKIKYDFKAFGQAIKTARKEKGISRNQLAEKLNIAPRYIASIENSGQHPSLQIFYELVTFLDVSVDQFFFTENSIDKSTQRRQLDRLIDEMESKDLIILTATAKGIQQAKLEKYERGTGYMQRKRPVQRIKLNLYNGGKSDFKLYDIEKFEIRNQYNEGVVALHKLGLVDFKWMAAEEGYIIAEVWLVFEQLGEAYRLIGRTPKGDTVDEVLLLLMEAQEKAVSSWLVEYLNSLIEAISRKRSVGSLLPGSLNETKDILCALIAADHLSEDEILERVFSIRCFVIQNVLNQLSDQDL